jgi:phosphoenolpyruvate phosphomutase
VLRDLIESEADFAVIVDSSPTGDNNRTVRDFAYCSRRDDRGLFGTPVVLKRVFSAVDVANGAEGGSDGESGVSMGAAHGRWIGMLKVSRTGLTRLKEVLSELRGHADFDSLDVPHLLNALIAQGATIEVQYVHGHWRGVNDLDDFRRAADFAHAQRRFGNSDETDAATPPDP